MACSRSNLKISLHKNKVCTGRADGSPELVWASKEFCQYHYNILAMFENIIAGLSILFCT